MAPSGESSPTRWRPLALEEGTDDGLGVQVAQVRVGLTGADKHDRLARHVRHGDGRADLNGDRITDETLDMPHGTDRPNPMYV